MTQIRKASPANYLMGTILAMAVVDGLAPAVHFIDWPWNLAGLIPLTIGASLISSSMFVLSREGTSAEPFQVPNALVTSGPFRFSRNPMYLGASLVLLGIALFFGSGTPFLFVPLYMTVIQLRVIAPEEKTMALNFGEGYAAYRADVRRWL